MHRQLIAVLDGAADVVDVGEVQPWVDPLGVEIERDVDQVDIAGALAVAKEAAFDPVRASHQRELTGCRAGATVVVGMNRQHHTVTTLEVTVHPLDHVGEDVGHRMLNRRRQVDDARLRRRGLPDRRHRIDHPLAESEFSAREHLRRVLKSPVGIGLQGSQVAHHGGMGGRQLDDAVLIKPQHHAPHHRCGGVVEVDDGAWHTDHGLESPADQMVARLCQHLDCDIFRDQPLIDQQSNEIEVSLRCRRETDLDLLEADTHQSLEHAQLACRIHRFDQRLVAVTQIYAAPQRWC